MFRAFQTPLASVAVFFHGAPTAPAQNTVAATLKKAETRAQQTKCRRIGRLYDPIKKRLTPHGNLTKDGSQRLLVQRPAGPLQVLAQR